MIFALRRVLCTVVAGNLGTRAGLGLMKRHEWLSAQVGLLRHPPSENISGGTERELACMHERWRNFGEEFARRD